MESLSIQLDSQEVFAKWALVHDRIAAGEMPPKSRESRPSEQENADALKRLDARLHDADIARIAKNGRALFRRLTTQEFENALRDLLYLPGLRIKQLLPEDERRHGYNKIGQALDLSNVHLSQFMDAADVALTAAIATRSTPPPVRRVRFGGAAMSDAMTWMAHGSAVPLRDKQYDPLVPLPSPDDDLNANQELKKSRYATLGRVLRDYPHAGGYFTGAVHRPMIFSLEYAPIYAGEYRIRTSAWGFWWDRGKVEPPHRNESFALTAWLPSDGPRFVHSPSRWLGLFDVSSLESRVHEYAGWFDVNEELVFDIGTLNGHEKTTGRFPGDAKGACAVYCGPGVALDWVEVEGPLFGQWPPRSHVALFGDLAIRSFDKGTEILPPRRTLVRQRSRSSMARPTNASIPEEESEPPLESVFSGRPEEDATRLLAQFLPRAFRRTVTAEELQAYVQIVARELDRHACFEDAVKEACKAALCSADFLFVGGDGTVDVRSSRPRLADRTIAERLALWLWNSVPDDELLAVANEGRLHLPEVLKQQTHRLLADPRSDRFIADFTDQWLDLRKIDATQPDLRVYPEAREHLKHSMIGETRAYLREMVTHDLSVTHLVKSDFAMLNQSLSVHYGISGVTGCAIRRVVWPADSPRGAFLTQAAVLKVTANGTTTSPVTRGAWMNERILGNPIPSPPADVPALDPDTRNATTIREKLEKHRADAVCAGCHAKIDPPGFALESFDVIGGFRERYRSLFTGSPLMEFHFDCGWDPRVRLNQSVDPSGQLSSGERFENLADFQSLVLRNPEALAANMVRQLLMYATGAAPHYSDRREIARIVAATEPSRLGLRSLIDAIVQGELFLSLESCVHEYQGWFDVNEELLFEIGTPTGYEKTTGRWASQSPGSCAAYSGPGIALDWFEVEGPVYEKWPPKSHTAIFGDLPIRPFASADGTIPPKRDPVRQRSRNGGTRPNNREITQRERESSLESVFSERSREDAARLLSQFLPRAFRRPVPDAERDGYVEIVLREMGTRVCFEDAMKEACKAALCSPDFLFTGDTDLKEQGVGTPRGVDRMVADRLALWFWNSIPDEELIRLAADEQLHLPENLQRQTTRLLSDARSDRFIADFTDQWLDLWKIDATQPDTKLYPEAREHLKQSMILETRAFFRELVTHNLSVTNLVKSEFAMINQSLAAHYGITGVSGCNLRRVPLAPDNPRGAFLTQAAVLKVTANGTSTSPVTRGAWINERILGNGIPPPPAGVPALDPDTRGAKTIREQLAKHRSDSRCAGCHSRIDPPGFALESFDVIGCFRTRYRSLSSGEARATFDFASGFEPKVRLHQKVDASGEMPTGEVFQSLEEFQQLVLRNPEALAANMVRQLLMYATGSEIRYSDRRAIARMVEQTRSSGHGLRSLIEAIVQSELFLAK